MSIIYNIQKTCFILVMAVFALAIPVAVNAQTPAASPCDPSYYDSLEARAWLEAQREITQNQNLIFKPDSVLQYTCFDKYLGVLARDAKFLFSEKGGSPNIAQTNMTAALQNLVGNAISSYIGGNFNHTMLGGHLTSVTYTPGAVSPGSYSCNIMNAVWEKAKCRDFIADTDTDGFYTFDEYFLDATGSPAADKRALPQQCPTSSARWKKEIDIAFNKEIPIPGTNQTKTTWTEDPVKTYLDQMDPANCAASKPISTGLTVIRGQLPSGYAEKVCLAPGCYYNPPQGSSNANSNDKCLRELPDEVLF